MSSDMEIFKVERLAGKSAKLRRVNGRCKVTPDQRRDRGLAALDEGVFAGRLHVDTHRVDAVAADNVNLGVLSPDFGLRPQPEATRGAFALATVLHSPMHAR